MLQAFYYSQNLVMLHHPILSTLWGYLKRQVLDVLNLPFPNTNTE